MITTTAQQVGGSSQRKRAATYSLNRGSRSACLHLRPLVSGVSFTAARTGQVAGGSYNRSDLFEAPRCGPQRRRPLAVARRRCSCSLR